MQNLPVLTWRIARGEDYNYLVCRPYLPGFKSYLIQNLYVMHLFPWRGRTPFYECHRFDTEKETTDKAVRDIQSFSCGDGKEITGMSWPVIAPLQIEYIPTDVFDAVHDSKNLDWLGAVIANYTQPKQQSPFRMDDIDQDCYESILFTLARCPSK